MMGDNVLEIRELSKDYGDFVLDKVSFSLPRGVIMGLIGENGAGKTTTIKSILNITNAEGNVTIFGKDSKKAEKEILLGIRRRIRRKRLAAVLIGMKNPELTDKIQLRISVMIG